MTRQLGRGKCCTIDLKTLQTPRNCLKKSLIEEPTVELLELFDEISTEAAKEKLAVPPINKMVYYWTRKPLIVGRMVALASTLNDIKSVRELLGFNKDRAYKRVPNTTAYEKTLAKKPSKIKVLDPFGGGGNLIFAVKRLGLDCTCSDYNPLAYLLEKAVLEFPVKYGTKLGTDFEKYANKVMKMTYDDVGKFYKKQDLLYFWTWCILCPHCKQRIPLANNMWLSNTNKKKIAIKFHPTKNRNFTVEIIKNASKKDGEKYTQKGGKALCIRCKNGIDHETMVNDIVSRKDRELNAIKIQQHTKREYIVATKHDKKLFKDASNLFLSKKNEYEKINLIPNEEIRPGHRDKLGHFGIKKWSEYFNDRQILTLITLTKNIIKICDDIKDKEYAKIMSVYLGFLLAKHVNCNSLGTLIRSASESISTALSLRMPPFVHNHAEVNSFTESAGSLPNMIKNIVDAIDFTIKNNTPCTIKLESVTKLNQKFDLIITDPPYGWDVQYGELSDFLYVWVYRCVKKYFTELPETPPLEEDFCVSRQRFQNQKLAFDFFEKGFRKSFLSMNKALKDDGLLVVFFAHSGLDAWNTLLESIKHAKFRIVSSYAVHTENTSNLIARNKTAFMSSIIVVCRKTTSEKTAYFEDIVPETEDRIKEMIKTIPEDKFLTLPITDLLIMVYGQVLEICTEFTELKSYQKNTDPKLETIIKNSQEYIIKEIVTKLTGRSINLIDPKMAFFLLARIFYKGIITSDDAIKISKAITVDTDMLAKEGVLKKQGGTMRLISLHETNFDIDVGQEDLDKVDVYQQLCYLCKICDVHGIKKIRSIITQSSGNLKMDDLKKIVSLLIKSARLRTNKNRLLSQSEKAELKILENLSAVWGGSSATIKGTMDRFME